jgi:hypothetical protein
MFFQIIVTQKVNYDRGPPEGRRQRLSGAAYVGIRLEPLALLGRLRAELTGAWHLKPYWGKPAVRNFREGGWKHDYGSRRLRPTSKEGGSATGP